MPRTDRAARAAAGRGSVSEHPGWKSCCAALTGADKIVILVTMTTTSLAEAKAHLSELVNRVSTQHERVTVTVHGAPSAVLLAPEDLESLEETLAILSDPDTMRRMAASEQELADGAGESESDLAAAMERRRHQQPA